MDKDKDGMGVGMPATLRLEVFGGRIFDAYGHHPYLVGSAMRSKQWRDVDVRLMLPDDEFAELFPDHRKPPRRSTSSSSSRPPPTRSTTVLEARWVFASPADRLFPVVLGSGPPIDLRKHDASHGRQQACGPPPQL